MMLDIEEPMRGAVTFCAKIAINGNHIRTSNNTRDGFHDFTWGEIFTIKKMLNVPPQMLVSGYCFVDKVPCDDEYESTGMVRLYMDESNPKFGWMLKDDVITVHYC